MHTSLLVVVSIVRCFVQILVVFCTGGALAIMLLAHYPLKPQVLKVEYVKPQNFKYGTTVECARKLSQS